MRMANIRIYLWFFFLPTTCKRQSTDIPLLWPAITITTSFRKIFSEWNKDVCFHGICGFSRLAAGHWVELSPPRIWYESEQQSNRVNQQTEERKKSISNAERQQIAINFESHEWTPMSTVRDPQAERNNILHEYTKPNTLCTLCEVRSGWSDRLRTFFFCCVWLSFVFVLGDAAAVCHLSIFCRTRQQMAGVFASLSLIHHAQRKNRKDTHKLQQPKWKGNNLDFSPEAKCAR